MIFVQQWPHTVCRQWKDRSSSNTCNIPKVDWTIHGIWPHGRGGGPTFCENSTNRFSLEEVSSLHSALVNYWPDIQGKSPIHGFWSYEWRKHGTCAVGIGSIQSQYDYFDLALSWRNSYLLRSILSRRSIVPSSSKRYSVQSIEDAVVSALGVRPTVQCFGDFIQEIRLCFDLNEKLKDCDYSSTRCYDEIIYPDSS